MGALTPGQRVRVHFNLTRLDFSVVDPANGRVLCNVPSVTLADVTFRVQEGMRQRVIRMNRRKVHAYGVGRFVCAGEQPSTSSVKVTYNPFRAGTFTDLAGIPVHQAGRVTFADRYCFVETP